eukprot:5194-Pyramimonas_sp.AAC.1
MMPGSCYYCISCLACARGPGGSGFGGPPSCEGARPGGQCGALPQVTPQTSAPREWLRWSPLV